MNFKLKLKKKIATTIFVFALTFMPLVSKAAGDCCYVKSSASCNSCATSDCNSCAAGGNQVMDCFDCSLIIEPTKKECCFKEKGNCPLASTTTCDDANLISCSDSSCKADPVDTRGGSYVPFGSSSTPTSTPTNMNFTYEPMEEIPGFGKPSTYEAYILAIYKFGLWTVGISAVFMISIGAFMYITSAGNTSQAGKAKGVIVDAIAGVILALLSYILLYTINPALLNINGVNQMIDNAARSYDGTYPTLSASLPTNCSDSKWQDIFSSVASSSGLDKCLLEAVAAKESECNQKPSRSNGGTDCGAMQTRVGTSSCNHTCDELEKDPKLAIECGANYLKNNYKPMPERKSPEEQVLRDYYAGFNGGPGALEASGDCPAATMKNSYGNPYAAWDCPTKCGGYCPVPGRTSIVLNYYNQCKARK